MSCNVLSRQSQATNSLNPLSEPAAWMQTSYAAQWHTRLLSFFLKMSFWARDGFFVGFSVTPMNPMNEKNFIPKPLLLLGGI